MKYIIPVVVMAACGFGISKLESYFVDGVLALVFCAAGFYLVKTAVEYFSLKNKQQ